MSTDWTSLIENWDGVGVIVRFDRPTATWIFVALHDTTLGHPMGGTRIKRYPTPADGLEDAMRLAEGMTCKWAGIGMPYGGGKAVLALDHELDDGERDGLLRRYGRFVESLGGVFSTGADLGAGPREMAIVASETRHVHGVDYDTMIPTDPGPFTAHGVLHGLLAAVRHVFGSESLDGRSVLVEGLGGVGAPLARSLAARGATLLLADLDAGRAATLAAELRGRSVPASDVPETPCDVYAPCAVGATLNRDTIPRLRCRIVAGSANNQLREPADADRLHERGILYVPDYVINAGGAMVFGLGDLDLGDQAAMLHRVEELGQTVSEILREAEDGGITPLAAAQERVERLLGEKRRDAA